MKRTASFAEISPSNAVDSVQKHGMQQSNTLHIRIQSCEHELLYLQIPTDQTLGTAAAKFASHAKVPTSFVALMFDGQYVHSSLQTISELGLEDGDMLDAIIFADEHAANADQSCALPLYQVRDLNYRQLSVNSEIYVISQKQS